METIIELLKLSKDYRDGDIVTTALSGISFNIMRGEFVAVMGPSGSGKSTLLHILDFLDRPTGGTYLFRGKSTSALTDIQLAHLRNKEMGFVFQAFNLLGRSSVYDNVELPLLYADVPVFRRPELVHKAIHDVGLEEKTYVPTSNLSGGQKQRVAIARALVNDPSIIFADEPTGNLDSISGGQVMEALQELNEHGRTIILVTHETYTARYAGRLIALHDGKVVKDESIADRHKGNGLIK
ncbi:MAG TPA: ABC transporter ATP-binding protein [Candidatus Paceibacterota bacterium]|nr:ABC transporter ATP-binding protein [Candidatus Paceibacterota bacterium]